VNPQGIAPEVVEKLDLLVELFSGSVPQETLGDAS
jgi:hypothetical protein